MPMTSPKYRFGGIFRNVVVSDGISGTFCALALFCAKAGTAHSKPTATKQHIRNRLIAPSEKSVLKPPPCYPVAETQSRRECSLKINSLRVLCVSAPLRRDSYLKQVLDSELHLPRDRVSRARDAAKPGAPEVVV